MGERLGGWAMNLLTILLPMWVSSSLFPIIDATTHLPGFSISRTRPQSIPLIVAKMEAQSPGFCFSSVLAFVSLYYMFCFSVSLFLCSMFCSVLFCSVLLSWVFGGLSFALCSV